MRCSDIVYRSVVDDFKEVKNVDVHCCSEQLRLLVQLRLVIS